MIIYEMVSKEESYFYDWLLELQKGGYVDEIQPEQVTFCIAKDYFGQRVTQQVTKQKIEDFILTKKRNYTPDFIFNFTEKAHCIFYHDKKGFYNNRPYFYCNNDEKLIYVDTKGAFNSTKSSITFPFCQTLMSHEYGIYVQKVIPFALGAKYINKRTLFKQTFTPMTMIKNEIYKNSRVGKWNKGESKLKYGVRTLQDFIKSIKKLNDSKY